MPTFASANDSLAQLVEHDTLNVGVQGSIPWRVTGKASEYVLEPFFMFLTRHGAIEKIGGERKFKHKF